MWSRKGVGTEQGVGLKGVVVDLEEVSKGGEVESAGSIGNLASSCIVMVMISKSCTWGTKSSGFCDVFLAVVHGDSLASTGGG